SRCGAGHPATGRPDEGSGREPLAAEQARPTFVPPLQTLLMHTAGKVAHSAGGLKQVGTAGAGGVRSWSVTREERMHTGVTGSARSRRLEPVSAPAICGVTSATANARRRTSVPLRVHAIRPPASPRDFFRGRGPLTQLASTR